ncbi:MAG TPA: formimidoylglutamate deiminase [Methylomirabilota bacterium]|nr:formimidoylglutamate deiminase [Methylomirabilota bacterium]
MTTLHVREALLPAGWARDVRIEIAAGRISSLVTGVGPNPGDERHAAMVPAVANLHSHAFQRGMAGLAEIRGPNHDTFWTWRDVMYRFALAMDPDDVEAVAAQLYVEMLEAGFCRVGEFHYLHHDRDGRPYADPAELATRIVAAAAGAGIGLTLLPVFYAHGGFAGAPPTPGPRRFITDPDSFATLLTRSRAAARLHPGTVVGLAPHSLRAVTPTELAAILPLALADEPIHIHAAEQVREVEDCVAWSGRRPVEYLLDEAGLDARWCLIHATHMTPDETRRLATSDAVAGLCPLTEASLGDGVFNGPDFIAAGGRYGVGSDSNVVVGIADELRQLETAQRLFHRERNVMATGEGASTGRCLLQAAVEGGSRALGAPTEGIAIGAAADLASLDTDHPTFAGRFGDGLIDSFIFAGRGQLLDCVWVGGMKLVTAGRHKNRDAIAAKFKRTMNRIADRIA